MAEVTWIKICTDIFDDEKILLIENMPEADSIIVIWFKLLCLAGKQNNGGVFMLNDKIAYTEEMRATIFRRPLNTVRLALKTFESYGMIEIVDKVVTIPNWEKHQSLNALEVAKEKNRQRVALYRARQKNKCNSYGNVTSITCNGTDKEEEIDKNRVCLFDNYNILQNNISESEQKQASKQANEPIGFYGVHKNIGLTDKQYKELDDKYSYAKQVINSLSEYKYRKGITGTVKDYDVLLEWLEKDKGRYEGQPVSFETDDFFEAALKRSYRREI